MLDKKYSNSRLAKSEKCEFTPVNDHFEDKHNAEVGLSLQVLFFVNDCFYDKRNAVVDFIDKHQIVPVHKLSI